MNDVKLTLVLIGVLVLTVSSTAQFGFSPRIDSIMNAVTTETLSVLNRQLSGDSTVLIGQDDDTVKSRYSYSPYNTIAAEYLYDKFQEFGLSSNFQDYSPNGKNVIGTKTGTVFPGRQYIICAHYDDLPNTEFATGADDNASGTCAVIEAARLCSNYDFPCTIKFIAFDEEEEWFYGSQAYVNEAYANHDTILGVLNLDMIAWDSNSDFALLIASDSASMPLFAKYIEILKLYQPILSPTLTGFTASDHSIFWNNGYPAVLGFEDYPGDFNPYHHTVNDNFSNLNLSFFLAMARGAVATLATLAWNYRMDLHHVPLASQNNTSPREAILTIGSPYPVATGEDAPRLYYKIDSGLFNYINPYYSNLDTFKFLIPGQVCGSKVYYYFAASDEGRNYVSTLPAGGKGVDPPGSQPGINFFSYYVLNEESGTFCSQAIPERIYGNSTLINSISIGAEGKIQDMNVMVTLTHSNTMDLCLYLISPGGLKIDLSSRNGDTYDNYTNTLFDDEAGTYIQQNKPPFTGSFKPEQPLSELDDSLLSGEWKLKIVNHAGTIGTLRHWCIEVKYTDSYYFVDAGKPVTGNGNSWATAFRTISEATLQNPAPGNIVFIKPGIYHERLNITSNGSEIIPMTTGVTVSNHNLVTFPAGTDLSVINLAEYPGEYYAYIIRSRNSNNGVFRIIGVNNLSGNITLQDAEFIAESGVAGDSSFLSAAVGKPVEYRRYSQNTTGERVMVDANDDPAIHEILYIGDTIGDGIMDANPANFNIIDGIDLTGSANGGGIHLQSSSFNVISNSRIYDNNGTGIYINGNADRGASYNLIMYNEIFNTQPAGITIGSAGSLPYNSHAYFNHFLGNEIHMTETGFPSGPEKAVSIMEYNKYNVVEGNLIKDLDMNIGGNGAISVGSQASHTLIYRNSIKDIVNSSQGINAMIMISGENQDVEVINNLLFKSWLTDDDLYAFRIDGSGHSGSRVVHNTVYGLDRGLLLEDYGSTIDFKIQNNIIQTTEARIWSQGTAGRFTESFNLYSADPTPEAGMPYFGDTGRQIGDPVFSDLSSGDFELTVLSEKAICNAIPLDPPVITGYNLALRYPEAPDIGAFELENKNVWKGGVDKNWQNPANWGKVNLPDSTTNVIIPIVTHQPAIYSGSAACKGLLVEPGSNLELKSPALLNIKKTNP
jgi:subtilisin-like proprotein convertase family protein